VNPESTTAPVPDAPTPPGFPSSEGLPALFFDGRSARGRPVQLHLADGVLWALEAAPTLAGAPVAEPAAEPAPVVGRWPLADLVWPERTRHGQRVVQLDSGGSLQCSDAAAFDAWAQAHGQRDGWVVRVQQRWRSTAAALAALLVVLVAGYVWGVPLAAQAVVLAVPTAVEQRWGDRALATLEDEWLSPSALPEARQAALRQAFAALVARAHPAGDAPAYQLHFRAGSEALGPNAFALPGGHIVMTDGMVELLQGHDDTVLAVLAHELGHVKHRHGLQGVVQLALVGAATGVLVGDYSGLLASSATVLGQLDYSRRAERQADAEAVALLQAGGVPPAAMVVLFERLQQHSKAPRDSLPVAFSSHPMDAERVAFFREAGRR